MRATTAAATLQQWLVCLRALRLSAPHLRALLVDALEVPGLVALVQLLSQKLQVGQVDVKQLAQTRPLHLDNHLLAAVQNSTVHLA
jgi:hypothetical protein